MSCRSFLYTISYTMIRSAKEEDDTADRLALDTQKPDPNAQRIVILGPPEVGKHNLADKLASQYEATVVSVKLLVASEIASNSELGQKAKSFLADSQMVPDNIVIKIVENAIQKCTKGMTWIECID